MGEQRASGEIARFAFASSAPAESVPDVGEITVLEALESDVTHGCPRCKKRACPRSSLYAPQDFGFANRASSIAALCSTRDTA